jgi:hypothetical protein
MVAYLKNRLPHKYLPSSISHFEPFHGKRPTISHLQLFRCKCYVYIREKEHLSRSKHLLCARKALIVGYTSAPKVYRVVTLEADYVFTTRDLTFTKKTSPQVGQLSVGFPRTRNWAQDRLGWTKDQRTLLQLDKSKTRNRAEDLESDQDGCWDLLKYPDMAYTFYNASHPVVNQQCPTLYELNTEVPHLYN